MVDFSTWEEYPFRTYDGANGVKKCLLHQGQRYMVKIMNPAQRRTNPMSAVSEYLSCHMYHAIGIPAQETILGTYHDGQKTFWAVACKDFCATGERLNEFSKIRNTLIDSSQSGSTKELMPILVSLEEQTIVPSEELKERFWNMFVVDALIGNFDRHTGNFGIISNEEQQTNRLAPVYDCGSALYPALSDEQLFGILDNPHELLARVYEYPASTYRDENNQKYHYHELLLSNRFADCTKALLRLKPKIDAAMPKIHAIVEATEGISPIRKKFYHTIIDLRKERIIDYCYEKLFDKEYQQDLDSLTKRIHQREEFLKRPHSELHGIEKDYVDLYQMVSQQIAPQTDKHLRNSDIDAYVIAILRGEKKYRITEIQATCMKFSPLALQTPNYDKRMVIKAKGQKFAKATRNSLFPNKGIQIHH